MHEFMLYTNWEYRSTRCVKRWSTMFYPFQNSIPLSSRQISSIATTTSHARTGVPATTEGQGVTHARAHQSSKAPTARSQSCRAAWRSHVSTAVLAWWVGLQDANLLQGSVLDASLLWSSLNYQSNHFVCHFLLQKGTESHYQCQCPNGFQGRQCESSASSCQDRPCQNGATCTSVPEGGYTCTCPAGYTGFNCDLLVDNCVSNDCENGMYRS